MQMMRRENIKENKVPAVSVRAHSAVPMYESDYILQEEEGSGGYGIVYKAQRKKDGAVFAVKYPRVRANKKYVDNELKMLERFGGMNFVIKYEGSFKSGLSHCLVLEHVPHDRPEVLMREIDVFQLKWYGYCLFTALASLHKQGVVHRDIKPANFLYSRKTLRGYLIDFNFATDLHQMLGSTVTAQKSIRRPALRELPKSQTFKYIYLGKCKSYNGASSKLALLPHSELLTSRRSNTSTNSKLLAAESKMPLFPKNLQKKKDHNDLNMHGYGITTSTPASKGKRVAGTPAKIDQKLLYFTPMPLQSTGGGLLMNKGDGKQKKEGPCVGTKGFRAPEVLLKSTYQGPKVDVWSAGVTLLYFIIGRTPFVGDPDQNIKEIAKLRGSEDLWEVAKLHDRESSFPSELLQVQSLASTKLREWCEQNTRRPDFLIPNSLIDLVDKCLTVNPRQRISAEEALEHEFFTLCHSHGHASKN